MFDGDGVALLNETRLQHDAHDASLAYEIPVGCASKHGRQQTRHEGFNLSAWVAKARDTHHSLPADSKDCSLGEREQSQPFGRDVLAHLPWQNMEATACELAEKLAMKQVNLPQIWLSCVSRNSGSMLYSCTEMRISDDTAARNKLYCRCAIF